MADVEVPFLNIAVNYHDDVIEWKHFPRYWPVMQVIHRSPMNSPHKGEWRGVLVFSLISVWKNGWVNNQYAGDLRRHRAHYDVTDKVMCLQCYQKLRMNCGYGNKMYETCTPSSKQWYVLIPALNFSRTKNYVTKLPPLSLNVVLALSEQIETYFIQNRNKIGFLNLAGW